MKKFFIVLALFVFVAAFSVGAIAVKHNTAKTETIYNGDNLNKIDAAIQLPDTSCAGKQVKDTTACSQHKEASCAHKSGEACAKKENCCSKSKSTGTKAADEKK